MKKKEVRLFENEFTFHGKHATQVKFLVNEAGIYKKYIDVYMNAAVLGAIFQRRVKNDTKTKDKATIFADAFTNRKRDCIFLFRLVMLLDEQKMTQEERLNRTFRYDADIEKNEKLKECIDIFNEYVRAGVEYMFETFTSGCTSKDDYIQRAFSVVKDFKEQYDGVSYEEKTKKLLEQ